MPVKDHLEISQDKINDLRSRFLNDLSTKSPDEVDPRDVEKVKTSDRWLQRFILHNEGNVEMALNMLWVAVKWRKDQQVNDINESNVKMDLICSGAFFTHGADIDGCKLLVFKCNKHVKGAVDINLLKRCIIYWFERVERMVNGNQITIFFDMEGCGLSNMDMEVIKYLIGLFKEYYPYFLNYILIFEMPWVLTAAFKIVKSWLPEKAVEKIKFVSKKDLKTFVPPEHILEKWGGQNTYVFSFVPETVQEEKASAPSNKKVHFVDGSMSEVSASSVDKESDGVPLKVTPSSIITFTKEGNELVSSMELQNVDSSIHISYKLKTTSPEKFRVKPSTGLLAPGESNTVTVTLFPGFQLGGLSKDKFLVMSTTLEPDEIGNVDSVEIWKNSSGRKINQHRLKCIQSGDMNLTGNFVSQSTPTQENDQNNYNKLSAAISQLSTCQNELHSAIRKTQYYQLATIILILFLAIILGYLSRQNSIEVSSDHSYCREMNEP
ncbi:motile sperm domain-containing protein 2 [Leptinotarsa decemlineata]|uniref:motile sperm domain-containing protein 2 n=1 Tax=Leptinotarsa decemlineata TaxID=7539 RepID=UPI003D3099E4